MPSFLLSRAMCSQIAAIVFPTHRTLLSAGAHSQPLHTSYAFPQWDSSVSPTHIARLPTYLYSGGVTGATPLLERNDPLARSESARRFLRGVTGTTSRYRGVRLNQTWQRWSASCASRDRELRDGTSECLLGWKQAFSQSQLNQSLARFYACLLQHRGNMMLHGTCGETKLPGNGSVAWAADQTGQDFQLAGS